MATAQMHRSSVSSVALPTRIATEQQSLVLVKRLLAVSVSCITYLRGLFPEYAYGTRYLEDICVKILREDKSCPGSTQLVKWMLGCYDALQRKYLRMVVLAICSIKNIALVNVAVKESQAMFIGVVTGLYSMLYTDIEDPQTITECYHFKFKYTPSGPIMDFASNKGSSVSVGADLKKSSILLIRKLYVLMQNLGPLPNDVCLTMKLFYYDEVTPADYQPPGFKEGTCDGLMFEGEPMYLNVGEVATPFHTLKVRVTTEKDRMENIEKSILKNVGSKTPMPATEMDVDEAQDTGSFVSLTRRSMKYRTSGTPAVTKLQLPAYSIRFCGCFENSRTSVNAGNCSFTTAGAPEVADPCLKGTLNGEMNDKCKQEDEPLHSRSVDFEKSDIADLKLDELNLACQEDEAMKSENPASQKSQNSVSLLGDSSSATDGRKTRSGRLLPDMVFAKPTTISEKKQSKASKGGKKRQLGNKENQVLDLSCSQEEPAAPKRKRFSEPKDPI